MAEELRELSVLFNLETEENNFGVDVSGGYYDTYDDYSA